MIQAMVKRMNAMKKTDLQMSFDRMIDTLDQESISEESDEDVVEVVRTGHTVTSGDVT